MNNWQLDNHTGIFQFKKVVENISYPTSGNDDSFEIENLSPWFNQRNNLINFFIKKYNPNGDFLDIGSGNGFQSKSIIDNGYLYKVICCEPGYAGCINSSKRGINYIYNGFFEDFPFDKFNIKAIGLFDVIEHLENDEEFLNKIYDKISNETLVFINVPSIKHLYSETDEFAGHFRRYNKKELLRIIRNTKYKLIDYSYFFNFYYIPILLLRAIPYVLGFKKGKEQIRISENSYLKKHNKILSLLSNWSSNYNLNKLKKGKKIFFGTSLFFILKK